MTRLALFGHVEITPEQFQAMAPHVKTEAALLARERLLAMPAAEWAKWQPEQVAAAIGADVFQFHDALMARHAFSPFAEIRSAERDEPSVSRAAVQSVLMPSRASARLLGWMVRQPGMKTTLTMPALEAAVGLGAGTARYAEERLQRQGLIERIPAKRARDRGFAVTEAGLSAAIEAGLVEAGSEAATGAVGSAP
jgi:hypothetical protein